jgi:FtsP/CotA-like multicopper oxidase with cupredoxin domain
VRYRVYSVLVGLVLCAFASAEAADTLPVVTANDNRTPAGALDNGILRLQLEVREGRWYPENDGGPYRDVYAFAEAGHTPQSSGPLIRVPQGTQIHVTIRNALPVAARIHGLHGHPGDSKETLQLAPGDTREFEFSAGEPGTYLYWATTSNKSLMHRAGPESALSGALVVDPPGKRPDDRIFVVGLWEDPVEHRQIPSINGKSWPDTDHLTLNVGQTYHWRVINGSSDAHAMHLHGFFFTVDGVGDEEHYERFPEERRRQAVTELIDPGHAFEMTWVPERAGNWLFHCHMLVHMLVPRALHPNDDHAAAASHSGDERSAGMGGLVIGLTVLPGARAAPAPVAAKAARKLQLVISENPEKIPLYRLEVKDPEVPAKPDEEKAPSLLGPPIVLRRGEDTEIEVRNETPNPTSIHWHGIELESYYDGVPGWTGSAQKTSPAIAPGTSFVARMTPPRAGTFIYHTHWHDRAQLLNGMYGPLIVVEPGQTYDPEHDKIFVVSVGDYAPFGEMILINGAPEPAPVKLTTGIRYRLRFINITANDSDLRVKLVSQEVPVQWTVVARDGADLPAAQRTLAQIDLALTVGSTLDVEYQSDREGYLEMQVPAPGFQAIVMQPFIVVAPK